MSKARRIDGVDFSHFQAGLKVNWPEAKKAGVKWLYHKASEGTDWHDQSYGARRQEALAEHIPFGAYHFAHPSLAAGSAKAEAEWFLRWAKPAPGDMVPMLDLEVNEHRMSEDQLSQWVAEWFSVVFAATGHANGFLYTPFAITHRPKGVHLWAARYNNDNRPPLVHQPFHTWSIWQFTDGQFGNPSVVPGVGRVDANTMQRRLPWVRISKFQLPVATPKHHKRHPAPKPTPIDKMIGLAKSQVGYHEGRDKNGTWNNIQKFSPAVPSLRWSQGEPWCATFVSWLALKSGLAAYFPCTASCDQALAWWKKNGYVSEYPAIGAQVLYGTASNMEHTGFVIGYDDQFVYTIEGNTNNNGSAEGDGVYLKKRLRADPYVRAYGYPQIPGVRLKSADPHYKG